MTFEAKGSRMTILLCCKEIFRKTKERQKKERTTERKKYFLPAKNYVKGKSICTEKESYRKNYVDV